jgi:hypothetical protein
VRYIHPRCRPASTVWHAALGEVDTPMAHGVGDCPARRMGPSGSVAPTMALWWRGNGLVACPTAWIDGVGTAWPMSGAQVRGSDRRRLGSGSGEG